MRVVLVVLLAVSCKKKPEDPEWGFEDRPDNATCTAPDRPTSGADIALERAFGDLELDYPILALETNAGDGRWFGVEQGGTVRTWVGEDPQDADLALDITDEVAWNGEAGLLGMALHPNFPSNGQAFLHYNRSPDDEDLFTVISRFSSTDGGATFDPESEEILLTLEQPYWNHNGGMIAFGPDGYLYIGLGDGGSGGDPLGSGQDTDSLLGKILRIDVDSGASYGIPGDNVFADGGGAPEVWAWGLRNPWRFSFDKESGDLWYGDVGQNAWEEVGIATPGGNHGWNIKEGLHCYAEDPCDDPSFVDPLVEYSHGEGVSVTGGLVYRGASVPSLVGKYVYGDFGSGRLWALFFDPDSGTLDPQVLMSSVGFNLSSFAEGADGELYLVDFYGGGLYRIIDEAGAADPFPQLLSETGCVDPSHPTRAADGLVPFGVNLPLWADGAEKNRWMAIPDGTTIDVDDDGHWEFPEGSVLMKEFTVDGKRVETRLLVRHDDGGWAGYPYRWNEEGTDAVLVQPGATVKVDSGTWEIPSSAQCLACHTAAAKRSLGPTTGQLNGDFEYDNGATNNQIELLVRIGMVEDPGDVATLEETPALDDADTSLGDRARAYLGVQCAHCHQPSGTAPHDLRASTPLHETGVCDVPPTSGDLGIADARLVALGDVSRSVLSARLHDTGAYRMPPLGTAIVDEAGTTVVDGWIAGLSQCEPPSE